MTLSNQGLEILENKGIQILKDHKGKYFVEPTHALMARTITEIVEPFTNEFFFLISDLNYYIKDCQAKGSYNEKKVELLITEIQNKICKIEKVASGDLKSIDSILDSIIVSLLEIQDECREVTCIDDDIQDMLADISEISRARIDKSYGDDTIVIY